MVLISECPNNALEFSTNIRDKLIDFISNKKVFVISDQIVIKDVTDGTFKVNINGEIVELEDQITVDTVMEQISEADESKVVVSFIPEI